MSGDISALFEQLNNLSSEMGITLLDKLSLTDLHELFRLTLYQRQLAIIEFLLKHEYVTVADISRTTFEHLVIQPQNAELLRLLLDYGLVPTELSLNSTTNPLITKYSFRNIQVSSLALAKVLYPWYSLTDQYLIATSVIIEANSEIRDSLYRYSIYGNVIVNLGLRQNTMSRFGDYLYRKMTNGFAKIQQNQSSLPNISTLIVYRGVNDHEKFKYSELTVGQTFTESSIGSYSLDYNTANIFTDDNIIIKLRLSGQPLIIYIGFEELSNSWTETELLFKDGLSLRVVNINEDGITQIITCDIVGYVELPPYTITPSLDDIFYKFYSYMYYDTAHLYIIDNILYNYDIYPNTDILTPSHIKSNNTYNFEILTTYSNHNQYYINLFTKFLENKVVVSQIILNMDVFKLVVTANEFVNIDTSTSFQLKINLKELMTYLRKQKITAFYYQGIRYSIYYIEITSHMISAHKY